MTESLSTGELVLPTASRILHAVREVVVESGFAALSTRAVADRAGVPLSQIHYHFGSKEQMILATLREENDSLVKRQAEMFALDQRRSNTIRASTPPSALRHRMSCSGIAS